MSKAGEKSVSEQRKSTFAKGSYIINPLNYELSIDLNGSFYFFGPGSPLNLFPAREPHSLALERLAFSQFKRQKLTT